MVTRTTPRTKQSMGMKSKKVKQHILTKKSKGTRKSKLHLERNIPNSNEQLNSIQPTLKTLSNRTKKLNTGRPQLKGSGLKLKLPKKFRKTRTGNSATVIPQTESNIYTHTCNICGKICTRTQMPLPQIPGEHEYAEVSPRNTPYSQPTPPSQSVEHVYEEIGNNPQPKHVYADVSNLSNAMTSKDPTYEEVGQIIASKPLVNNRVLHTTGTMTNAAAATYAQPTPPNMTSEEADTYAQPTPPPRTY